MLNTGIAGISPNRCWGRHRLASLWRAFQPDEQGKKATGIIVDNQIILSGYCLHIDLDISTSSF